MFFSVSGFLHRKSSDSSFTAHVGRTMIMLLEGVPPGMQSVFACFLEVVRGTQRPVAATVQRSSAPSQSIMQ